MAAFPGTLLYLIGIYNPFPVTLRLSVIAIAVFGVELAIVRLFVHPQKWLYFLIAGCLALGVMLAAWSGYFTLYGPSFIRLDSANIDFYWSVRQANIKILFVMGMLVLGTCILLITQRRQSA